jgi:tetratricopeptide (TPR) repeat protein
MAGREENFQKAMSMGHSMAWDQQWDKAAAAYRNALDEIPNHPKALSSLGLALYELQRYDESIQIYQKAAQAAPNDPVPLEKVGQLSERLGNIQEAVQSFLKAAELYVKNQDADKALANWLHVIQLDSDHFNAHSYLAMVHERLGHTQQAATEYLTVASLLQRSGNVEKAAEMIGRALHLIPNNPEARQAQVMLKAGKLLPKPKRPQGGTGPLRMAQVKQLQPPTTADSGLDPIAEARKHSLTRLAELLFDLSDGTGKAQTPKSGMQAIVRGTGELNLIQSNRSLILLHIGQAIDAQSKDQESLAAEELEQALVAGFVDAALYFSLGLLRSKTERLESAMRHLQNAVKHPDYALAAHLLLGQIQRQMGRLPEAATEYMEALKVADSMVVPPEQADDIRQLYEPLIESHAHQTDTVVMEQLCDNVDHLLVRPNWRAEVLQAREQLPKSAEGSPPMPLAEILAQAQSGQVIETIGKVRALARAGHLRTAMDEAYDSFKYAPTYLPLHTLIGDLLIQDGRIQDAITKYTVVAEAYSVRGEATQAVNLLRRIVQVAPMDMTVRTRLIDQLAERGMVDEAIDEYNNLADIYYRLAELDLARKTFATALHLAQQGGANPAWSVKLMRRMADIDMQRLDLRQALRIFEQLRTLEPEDSSVRKSLIDLNLRLTQVPQAAAELEGFLAHLQSSGRRGEAIPFLEELVTDYPKQSLLRLALAEEYRQANRLPDAIAQLDPLSDLLLKAGDRDGAIQNIETIMAMNPPNKENYRTQLAKIKSEA